MFWLVLNFKAYKRGIGKEALKLAKVADEVADEVAAGAASAAKKSIKIIICVQPSDIALIAPRVKIPVWAQHIDPELGPFTGSICGLAVKQAGASGTLINHSEKRLSLEEVKKRVDCCKALKLKSAVCVANISEAAKVLRLKPDFIAFEVPELIGTGRAISKYRPESVKQFVQLVEKHSIPLCGAGIASSEDVRAAKELGCKGVLVASAFVNAKKPKAALMALASLEG